MPSKRAYRFHADDVGRNENTVTICRGLAEKGWLNSYSVMANGAALHSAALLHKDFPNIPVSLHFDVVSGQASAGKSSLTNKHGVFSMWLREAQDPLGQLIRMAVFSCKIVFRIYKRVDIERELQAQLHVLKDHGFEVKGIDTEQHLHAYEPFASVILTAAHEQKLLVRGLSEWQPQTKVGKFKFGLFKFSALALNILYRLNFHSPTSWWPTNHSPYVVASWEQIHLDQLPKNILVECHPGTDYDINLWSQIKS